MVEVQRNLSKLAIPVVYDVVLALLYTWAVFQAYVYDAKTQTTGILVYVVVYGMFTLLVRSLLGVFLMNTFSFLSLFWLFYVPVISDAGSYFDFQPYLGMLITVLVFFLQASCYMFLRLFGMKFLTLKYQYMVSLGLAVIFTVVLTVVVHTTVPTF